MKKVFQRFSQVVLFCFAVAGLHAQEAEAVIQKARAFLGAEEALEAVESLRYEGRILNAYEQSQGILAMILKKPDCQRIETFRDGLTDITVTNGFEGYQQFFFDDGEPPKLYVLKHQRVQELVINARENLYFFDGFEHSDGEMVDGGEVVFEGKKAYLITFSYPNEMYFKRYFDLDTGKLLSTETSRGLRLVEENYTQIEGVRFPRRLSLYKGDELVYRVVFDRILVNPQLPEDFFEFPALRPSADVQ